MKKFGKLASIVKNNTEFTLLYHPIEGQVKGPEIEIHPLVAAILFEMDRQQTDSQIAARFSALFNIKQQKMQEIVDDVDVVFRNHFSEQYSNQISNPFQFDYEGLINALLIERANVEFESRNTLFKEHRSPFPLTVQWLVTELCNRKCVYCYQGAELGSKASDSIMPLDELKRLIREAAQLGSTEFFLTGGEPLLRDDIYDIIVYALECGITPEFISKQFIPETQIKRLASAGLQDIYLSIDSLEKESATKLTGIGGFAKKIAKVVACLTDNGIKVHAKSLLTSVNADDYPVTLKELQRLGATSIVINTYSENVQRHDDALTPTQECVEKVKEAIKNFKATPSNTLRVEFSAGEEPVSNSYEEDSFICHNGRTQLLFYPNGDISRCDKSFPGKDMIVGSILGQSILGAWNSPELLESLNPPRSKYKGTPCYTCNSFDTCNYRGRCYYGAFISGGTLYGPQEGACKYMLEVKNVC